MSSSIDERIVAMRFDNEQFERHARQTMETCRELRESTNMDGVAEQFQTIGKVAKKSMNFQNPIRSTNLLSRGLSSLGRVAKGVFSASTFPLQALSQGLQELGYYTRMTLGFDIAGTLVNAGKEVVQAFTIEPMRTGWSEYELKMDSIKTIMTGTEQTYSKMMEAKSPGWVYDEEEHLAYVKNALEELNKYADDTIYSFQEMINTIGKFTSKGIDLETSVAAVKGIANLAAYSGRGSEEANRAYYNLSQALGMGYLGTRDWMSIEQANLDTLAFKQTLVDLGVAMGTLEKQGEKVLVAGNKKVEVTAERLRDTLNEKWVTNEVLLAALQIFSGEEMNAEALSAMYKLTHEEAEAMIKLGQDAKEAAKQVRTFSKMWEALKEAAQSGWAFTWELITGDSQESLKFWTDSNDRFSAILNEQAESRNAVLREWRGMQQKEDGTWEKIEGAVDGRTVMIEGLNNMLDITETLVGSIGRAWENVFGKVTGQDLLGLTTRFRDFSERFKAWLGTAEDSESRISKITESLEGLFSVFKIGKTAFAELGKRGWNILKQLLPDFDKVMAKTSPLRNWLKKVADQFEKDRSFKNLAKNITDGFTKVFSQVRTKLSSKYAQYTSILSEHGLGGVFSQVWTDIKGELAEWGIDLTPIENFVAKISEYFSQFKQAFTELTGIELKDLDTFKASLIEKLKDWGIDTSSFSGFVDSIKIKMGEFVTKFSELTHLDFSSFDAFKGSLRAKLQDWDINTDSFSGFVDSVTAKMGELAEKLLGLFGVKPEDLAKWKTDLLRVLGFGGSDTELKNGEEQSPFLTFVEGVTSRLSGIKEKFEEVTGFKLDTLREWWEDLRGVITRIGQGTGTGDEAVESGENAESVLDKVVSVFSNLKETVTSFINWAREADWEQIGTDVSGIVLQIGSVLAVLGFGTLAAGAGKLVNNSAKAVKSLQNAEVSIGGLVEVSTSGGLTGVLDSAKEGLSKVLNKTDKMGTFLLEFGAGIALLAEGLKTISEIPEDRLTGSVGIVALLSGIIGVFDIVDKKLTGPINKTKIGTFGKTQGYNLANIVAFITGINTLVAALKEIDTMDHPWNDTFVIAGLTAVLGVFDLYEKNHTLGDAKGFSLANILALVLGISTLVNALGNIDTMDHPWDDTFVIAGLTAILGVFDLYEKNHTLDDAKGFSLANILALVLGINTLVNALGNIDTMDHPWDDTFVIAGLTAIMGVFAKFASWDSTNKMDWTFAVKIATMTSAVNSLVNSLVSMKDVEFTQALGSTGIIALLTGLIGAFAFVGTKLADSDPLAGLAHIADMTSFAIAIKGLTNSVEGLSKVNPERLTGAVEAVAALTGLVTAFEGLGQLINASLAPTTGMETLNQFIGPLSSLLSIGGLLVGLAGLIVGVKLLGEMDKDKLQQGIDSILALSGIVTAFSIIIGTFSTLGLGGSVKGAIAAGAGIAVFTVLIGSLLYGLNWLTELDPGFVEKIQNGAEIVRSIFEGVGQILAGIVSPIASIFMPETKSVGEASDEFVNLEGQLIKLGEIGGKLNIDGFNKMMDAVGKVQEIANVKINDATLLSKLVAGEKTLLSIGPELGKFGEGVKTLGEKVEDTNLDNVERAAGVIKTLAEALHLLQGITINNLGDLSHLLGFQWYEDYKDYYTKPTNWSAFFEFFSNLAPPINEGIAEGALFIDSSPIVDAIVAGITGGSDQIQAAIAAMLSGIDLGSGEETVDLSNLNLADEFEGALEESDDIWSLVRKGLSQMGIDEDLLPDMSGLKDSMVQTGTEMVDGLVEGLGAGEGGWLDTLNGLFELFNTGADANKGNAYNAGSDLAKGAISGAAANNGRFYALGVSAGTNYLNGFKWAAKIGSPSKAMIEMMGYIADGFDLGQERYGGIFTETGEKEADAYLQAMKQKLEPLSLAMAEGIDTTPVIRPVFDMSGIDAGMQRMRGAFGRGYSIPMTGNMPALVGRGNVPVTAAPNPNQNGSSVNRAIEAITDRIDRMQDAIEHWEMVLDSGELVGGIVNKMDRSLGVRAAKARRRG